MNILALNYEYPPLGGGGGVVFKQIIEELATRHQISVITSAFPGLERYESEGNLQIHRIPVLMRKALSTASMPSMLSYWPSSWRHGRKLLEQRRFDLINSHFAVPSSPSADQLSRRFGIPHVLSIHGGDIFDPSKKTSPHRVPLVRGLVRRLLGRADRVAAQSNNTADNARRFYGVTRPIDIIPLGIKPGIQQPRDRRALGIEEDRFVMVTVGRLVARKGVDDLIHVLADLDDPGDLLIVIGDGPKRAEWEALAKQLGVKDRVRFTGFVDLEEKQRLLAAADLFASTSLHEGFGLVFLEAMEQELPVVAYDHGGQTDFLEEGKTGCLISLGNRSGFVEAITRLKESPPLRRRCGQYNRDLVKDYYIDRCAQLYERLFDQLVSRRTAPRHETHETSLTG